MKISKWILIAVLVISYIGKAFSLGETGAPFLTIDIGARATAMGGAYTSLADDPTALYWNPAGIASVKRFEVELMQNFWIMDMGVQFMGVVFTTKIGSFGASVIYSGSGELERYENFQKTGDYSAYDLAMGVSYAKSLPAGVSVGLTVKGIQQVIDDARGRTVAGDFGVLWKVPFINNLNAGLSVSQIGRWIRFYEEEDPLPLTARFGLSYALKQFNFAADINRSRGYKLAGNFGTECKLLNVLSLRLGYNTRNSVTAGAGFTVWKTDIGYCFAHMPEMDGNHVISIKIKI